MEIKRATKEDYERLKAIKLLSKKEELKYSESLKPIEDNEEYFYEYLNRDLKYKSRAIFYAEEKGEIVGFILAQWFRPLPISKFKRKGYVSNLFVKKEARKKGIANKLIETALNWLKEWKTQHISLEIHVDNKAAQQIYKKFGFSEYTIKMTKTL